MRAAMRETARFPGQAAPQRKSEPARAPLKSLNVSAIRPRPSTRWLNALRIGLVVLIVSCAVHGYRSLATLESSISRPSPTAAAQYDAKAGTTLSYSWVAHLALSDHVTGGAKVWPVYAGLHELRSGGLVTPADYVIHALGPIERNRYVAEFLDNSPEFVRTDPTGQWDYGTWLLSHNWEFYREVVTRYQVAAADRKATFWKKGSIAN